MFNLVKEEDMHGLFCVMGFMFGDTHFGFWIFFFFFFFSTNLKNKLGFCNQSICDYLQLFVICNYHWLFLQLFFVFGCACNYTTTTLHLMFFSFFFGQLITWYSSKKTHLCPISCKCGNWVTTLCLFKVYFAYYKVYGFKIMYYMYSTH
jgi:hypothetical protein